MMPLRRPLVAALAATAAFAVGTPSAGAQTAFPVGGGGLAGGFDTTPVGAVTPGPCSTASGNADGEGGTGRTTSLNCVGAGLTFTGPAIGQIATVIGPTTIGPAFVGASVVSAGNGSIGP